MGCEKEGLRIKIMGKKPRFWVIASLLCSLPFLQRRHRTVMADGHPLESDTFFRMHWNCGRIILQSPNGRFLGIVANGLLMANATIPGESSSPPARLFQVRDAFRESWGYERRTTGVGLRRFGFVYLLSHRIFISTWANHISEAQFHCLHHQWR